MMIIKLNHVNHLKLNCKLGIILTKTNTYVKCCDGETKWMNFLIEDDDLLEIYNDIWIKVNNSIKKVIDCGPIYNYKLLKTQIRSYSDEATDFHTRKIPEAGSDFIYWPVITFDSVLEKDEKYYLQVF